MKKAILFSLALIFTAFSYAQVVVPKGQKVIGGSVSFGSGRNHFDTSQTGRDPETYNSFQTIFNPSFGWAKKDNQLYGILLHSQYNTWKSERNNSITKGSYFAAGPGVFYERFFPLGQGFNFSANGALRATYGEQKSDSHTGSILTERTTGRQTDVNFSVTPKIGYSFNKRWMAQASIGEMLDVNYSKSHVKSVSANGNISESDYNNLSVNTRLNRGLSLSNIGLTFRYSF